MIVALLGISNAQMTVTGDSGTTIPPDDFVFSPSAAAQESSATRGRAFFRKPARGSGHGHRGGTSSRAPSHSNRGGKPSRGGNGGGKPSRGGSRGGRGGRGRGSH